MLLMCHLFIGLVIGMVIFHFLEYRMVIILSALGSILPDLIDKPLGHIILTGSIDFGRIYAHSGLFFTAILVLGVAYRRKKGSWIMMALGAGLLSHLVLDSMWELPVTVFYPFLGDFGLHHFPNYVGDSFTKEIESTYEWTFGVTALAMLMFICQDRLGRMRVTAVKYIPQVVKSLSLLLMLMGMVAIIYAAMSAYNPFSGDSAPDQNLILGLSASVGGMIAYLVWRDMRKPVGTEHLLDQ
ncbi:MAG TPA: metal-dependent hydrolase [Methanomassiliicoccales archaeon]|jgi:membrane-bound metal-dependent hydrolase YbcI (DUF457 family)